LVFNYGEKSVVEKFLEDFGESGEEVFLLQRLGWGARREVLNDSVMRTGVWSEESSKQDLMST
jgi:hypothetical protein